MVNWEYTIRIRQIIHPNEPGHDERPVNTGENVEMLHTI